jgi:hypothetical protein
MAITVKKKLAAAQNQRSTSTHFPNETPQPKIEDAAEALNNQTPNILSLDLDDVPGSTHFTNETKYSEKTNRIHSSNLEEDLEDDEDLAQDLEESLEDEDLISDSAMAKAPDLSKTAPGDTQHLRNGVNPAEGYLANAATEEDDLDSLSGDKLSKGDNKQQELIQSNNEEEEDWDEDSDDFDDGEDELDDIEDQDDEPEEDDDDIEDDVEAAIEPMSLLDIDGTDDIGDDVVFASIGTRLHAIKGNRIIASLSKKVAAAAGNGDIYLSDQFQDTVAVEMAKRGMREGLSNMGFVFATVDVSKNEVLNKRVNAKTEQVTAAIKRTNASYQQTLQQSLAIAAVGINRSYFKNAKNPLKAALQEELEAAGVRGSSSLLKKVFASEGVNYTKSLMVLASKICEMPEKARNGYVAALDMTSDGTEISDDDYDDAHDVVDNIEEILDDGDGVEIIDDEIPTTVSAGLAHPIHKRIKANTKEIDYSARAEDILNGKAPFPLLYK